MWRFVVAAIVAGFLIDPALAQVSALPANNFMASPSGASGFLAPRAIVSSDISLVLATPPPIGSTVPNTGAFTTISSSGLATLASATVTGALTGNNITSTEFPGLSANVEAQSYPGLDMNPCTSLGTCTWFIYQKPTNQTGTLQSPLYVQRNTQGLTGTCPSCGTTATVPAAILAIDYSGRNDNSWNSDVVAQLINQSLGTLGSQDAAGLFYGVKQTSTGGGEVGFTWGMNAYCYDQQPTVNPVYSCIGAEIDAFTVAAAGADTNAARVALSVIGGVASGTDAAVHIGTGIQIGTIGGATVDRGLSYFAGIYGTLITTRGGTVTATNGIDWSSATFSGFEFKTADFLLSGGNVTITNGTPQFTLNNLAAGQARLVQSKTNGVLRWQMQFGDTSAEGGANAGSNFNISNFSDAGGFLGSPLTITRSSGLVTLTSGTLGASIANTISFYGAAPVAQRAAGNNAVVPAGGTGTAAGGWDTAAHRDTAIATINEIRTTLINLGIMPST